MTIVFRTIFQTWVHVLTRPGIDVFKSERLKPSATLTVALLWIALAATVTALLQLLHAQLFPFLPVSIWPYSVFVSSEIRAGLEEVPHGSPIQTLSGIVTTPVGFIIIVGVQHLIASQLGMDRIRLEPPGEKRLAKFGRYAYLNAAFSAPLSILTSLFSFVPLLFSFIYFIVGIYQMVLAYFATKAEYGLSRGRVIVVILAGPLIAGGGTGLLSVVTYFLGAPN